MRLTPFKLLCYLASLVYLQLDLAQMFPRPIVIVNGTRNVSKLMAALQRQVFCTNFRFLIQMVCHDLQIRNFASNPQGNILLDLHNSSGYTQPHSIMKSNNKSKIIHLALECKKK